MAVRHRHGPYTRCKIQKVCSAFSLPTKIQASAIMFFKRFLLDTRQVFDSPIKILFSFFSPHINLLVKKPKLCSNRSSHASIFLGECYRFRPSLNSLLLHNLKVMMLTSIYVACKVEENYVSAEEFGKGMHEVRGMVNNLFFFVRGLTFYMQMQSSILMTCFFHASRTQLEFSMLNSHF